MDSPKPLPDYAPSPASRVSIPAALVYAGFVTAILYLLYFHLASDTPLHSGGNPPPGLAQQRAILGNLDALLATAADGHDVQYHVRGSTDDWAANGKFFDTAYLSAVYSQYPARVVVGDDTAVINFAADLQNADQLPSDDWLRRQHIAMVFNLLPGNENGPQVLIHPVR